MAKMDWKRTRKFRNYEEKYEPGTTLKNGRFVPDFPRDSLAARAAKSERNWLAGFDEQPPTKKRSKPNPKRKPLTNNNNNTKSDEAKLLHQVVMALINIGQGHILNELPEVCAYFGSAVPTVADIVGGRPEMAIIEGGITWDDKVYRFSVARAVKAA